MRYITLLAGVMLAAPLHADMVINFSGMIGSPVVSFDVSGTVDNVLAVPGRTSGIARLPRRAGDGTLSWNGSTDENIGDVLNSTGNTDMILSSPVIATLNGLQYAAFDTIDFLQDSDPGEDDIQLDPTTDITYPELFGNGPGTEIIRYVGSGTFTLNAGTYDTVLNPGTYESAFAINDGSDRMIYNVAEATAVPEPSTLLLGLIGSGVVFARRRLRSRG